MGDSNQFDWVDFYKELSSKLLQYKNNREELIWIGYNKLDRFFKVI